MCGSKPSAASAFAIWAFLRNALSLPREPCFGVAETLGRGDVVVSLLP